MNRSGNRPGNRPGARGQRGFTLIELMVALLVSSLLVGMILAIFSRMSLAYRGQQQIAGVQQILAAARGAIEFDAKQAGLGMPQGFRTAIPGLGPLQSPVQVTNSNAGPDQIALFYADTSTQALVSTVPNTTTITTVGPPAGFASPMLVVLTTPSTATNPLSTPASPLPDIATYDTCVLKIANVDQANRQITFDITAPWGTPAEDHCTTSVPNRTMIYAFVAHAYRIDPTAARLPLGMLQRSATGGLLSSLPGNLESWDDLAYGFSDIQTAVRIYDPAATDLDNDGDPSRNWYSSAEQDAMTRAAVAPSATALLGISISLVAHTDRNVEGIATGATPSLIGPPPPAALNAAHNSIGDRPSTTLPVVPPDPLRPGQRIYRWTTLQVDFRNLGVGVAL